MLAHYVDLILANVSRNRQRDLVRLWRHAASVVPFEQTQQSRHICYCLFRVSVYTTDVNSPSAVYTQRTNQHKWVKIEQKTFECGPCTRAEAIAITLV